MPTSTTAKLVVERTIGKEERWSACHGGARKELTNRTALFRLRLLIEIKLC